jgi:hypothetical protein
VTSGSVIRSFTTALFSRNCAWLFVGSTSGDVVGVNVARKAIQVTFPPTRLRPTKPYVANPSYQNPLFRYSELTSRRFALPFCLCALRQSTHPVCSLGVGALLLEGDALLVAGGDGSLTHLRPLEMRTSEKPRAMLPGGVTSLSRTADGRGLIAATDAGRICRSSPLPLPRPPARPQTQLPPLPQNFRRRVGEEYWSRQSKLRIVCNYSTFFYKVRSIK